MKLMHGLLSAAALVAFAGAAHAAPKADKPDAKLEAAVSGTWRPAEEVARDQWRRPRETLQFFGLKPGQTVVELSPGRGWYTAILAPYANTTKGKYIAVFNQPQNDSGKQGLDRFKTRFADEKTYGKINVAYFGAEPMCAPGSADMVLTFRNVHNFIEAKVADQVLKSAYDCLKPGGVLGVVDHRADEAKPENLESGYVKQSTVVDLVQKAGFTLVEASEINANPKDTKDHPWGVWTLPPVRRTMQEFGKTDPNFDRAKYDAIGESDRMTLKFQKPQG